VSINKIITAKAGFIASLIHWEAPSEHQGISAECSKEQASTEVQFQQMAVGTNVGRHSAKYVLITRNISTLHHRHATIRATQYDNFNQRR
jgi:hypothetical protein